MLAKHRETAGGDSVARAILGESFAIVKNLHLTPEATAPVQISTARKVAKRAGIMGADIALKSRRSSLMQGHIGLPGQAAA